jgi:acetyl esterase/lipase
VATGATFEDILALPSRGADQRIPYGAAPQQFADLYLPRGQHSGAPVVVLIHGGCWESEYDLSHLAPLASAIADLDFAVWSLEYRRIGQPGGGWPGTLRDAGAGIDALRTHAREHLLDLDRVLLMGHSAGGHLALWSAGRANVPKMSAAFMTMPLKVRGVVGLAAISDLRAAYEERVCDASPSRLLGGTPREVPDRYLQASPASLLPLGVPQRLIHGSRDRIVPASMSRLYCAAAVHAGDSVAVVPIDGATHFDVISPRSSAWPAIVKALQEIIV